MTTNNSTASPQPVVMERIFDAPPDLVWQAWTDPEHLKRWWGPQSFTAPVAQIDLRVGGKYLFCMQDPDGNQFWSTGTYKEIVPGERLVCTDSFADEHGNIVSAESYGMEGFPLELEVVVTFEDLGGKTRMTVTHYGMPAGEMRQGATVGWNQSFDKLAAALAA
jgi:uncharacterized protein YndB with AHSA1/START domain